jgi:hypothetical protein
MKHSISAILVAAFVLPTMAQIKPPTPGTGTCPESCIPITTPAGALLVCCGEAEGCQNCAAECTARCPDGSSGNCVDLGDTDLTCTKGCEVRCNSPVSASKMLCAKLIITHDDTNNAM